jgi:hypothetical protein
MHASEHEHRFPDLPHLAPWSMALGALPFLLDAGFAKPLISETRIWIPDRGTLPVWPVDSRDSWPMTATELSIG